MKSLQVTTVIFGVALSGLGVAMAMSNPSQSKYEEFAAQQLATYVKDNFCTQAPKAFSSFLEQQCKSLVDTGRPQIRQLISQSTQRQNYILFSVYQTDLTLSSLLPSYHFETVAVFENFYIYQADQN